MRPDLCSGPGWAGEGLVAAESALADVAEYLNGAAEIESAQVVSDCDVGDSIGKFRQLVEYDRRKGLIEVR